MAGWVVGWEPPLWYAPPYQSGGSRPPSRPRHRTPRTKNGGPEPAVRVNRVEETYDADLIVPLTGITTVGFAESLV